MEPMLTPQCRGAVHLPDEGLIDPVRLTCGYAELAAANGASIRLSCPAMGFDVSGGPPTPGQTPAGPIPPRCGVHPPPASRPPHTPPSPTRQTPARPPPHPPHPP